ncbi:MAG: ABC transporter ATP-binding protein/permease [Nitrospira sp.]|nr:ABC transporter ATP-binding protein/permease [Nitrospira sp.]MDH4251356.1 ABC transporter ATP-binding protein/permease [Nitrospira sp.]MDH4343922.1 ABC transporter ATP-binding protein/permease [Nitrospira sp.]
MGRSLGTHQPNLFHVLRLLGRFFQLERRILALVVSYALVIGLFSLIVPLTVQELVNTFSFAIQPIMIATLAIIMVVVLTVVGAFKALQYYAVEVLQRRLFVRTAFAMAQKLPLIHFQGFRPRVANVFIETAFMQRALSVLLVDLIHVVVGGVIGMMILVFYHPYFILFNLVLLIGSALIFFVLSRGGLRTTVEMSHAKYDVLHWIQEISQNLLHIKATDSRALLMEKTDQLAKKYMDCRRARFAVLLRQFIASVGGQALAHSGALALAGWLLSIGQLTLGQLVAVEVVVGSLLINFDAVVKSMGQVYFFFTALVELDTFFSLPKDQLHPPPTSSVTLPDPKVHGIRVTCKGLGLIHNGASAFDNLDLDVTPGEKVAIYTTTTTTRMALARVLAGLEPPTTGIISYNDVELRHLDLSVVNQCRGFMIDSHLSLIDGTIADNIVWRRSYISYEDVRWALWLTQLQEEVAALPLGLNSDISTLGEIPAPAQVLRILLARAILGRPQLLIFDGMIHDMQPPLRDIILRRLCSKDQSWTVIFVSNDPGLTPYVDRRIVLGDLGSPVPLLPA